MLEKEINDLNRNTEKKDKASSIFKLKDLILCNKKVGNNAEMKYSKFHKDGKYRKKE